MILNPSISNGEDNVETVTVILDSDLSSWYEYYDSKGEIIQWDTPIEIEKGSIIVEKYMPNSFAPLTYYDGEKTQIAHVSDGAISLTIYKVNGNLSISTS